MHCSLLLVALGWDSAVYDGLCAEPPQQAEKGGICVPVGADLLGQGWSHEEWPFITGKMQGAGPH